MTQNPNPIEGIVVDHGPVHMPAEDYQYDPGSALVPVARGGNTHTIAIPNNAGSGNAPQVIVIHQAPAEPASKWTPGNMIALAVVAIVGIVALVVVLPLIVAALQTLMVGLIAVAAAAVFVASALRRNTPAPETKRRRRWGR